MVRALILAGAPNTGPLASVEKVSNESLVKVGGRPLISWVVQAFQEAETINEIVVVGPEAELAPHVPGQVRFVAPQGSLLSNIRAGLAAMDKDEPILISTSDIPLITGEIVDDFIHQCAQLEADFYYPIIERSVTEARFPDAKRTWVATADGTFTGGNFWLMEPTRVMQSLDAAEAFIEARKSPLKLAIILGPIFILKLLLKRATVVELEHKISSLAGARGRAVITPHPEIGFDVDKPEHIPPVERALRAAGRIAP